MGLGLGSGLERGGHDVLGTELVGKRAARHLRWGQDKG